MQRLYSMKNPFFDVFSVKFDLDHREPAFIFQVPHVGKLGFVALSPMFWLQCSLLLMVQSILNVVSAIVVFLFIVQGNKNRSLQSYIIGYGIIGPLLVYIPLRIVSYLELQNVTLMMSVAGGTPAILIFRLLEAMHGTLPPFATQSFSKFVLYCSSTVQFEFDKKTQEPVPMSRTILLSRSLSMARLFVQSMVLYSLLLPCSYNMFPRRRVEGLWDLFYWGNLLNNYIMAWVTATCLEASITGLGLLTSLLTGICTMQVNDSPLTASTSPSDFWGKRWNRMVGSSLRRAIYQPLRNGGYSIHISALMAFFVSGLMHEYLLLLFSLRGGSSHSEPYAPSYGNQSIFFLWNGLVLIGEYMFSETSAIRWIREHLPQPFRTLLVLALVIPVVHFFTDEFVASGAFTDQSFMYPKMVYLSESSGIS
jgi:hypothetical protein